MSNGDHDDEAERRGEDQFPVSVVPEAVMVVDVVESTAATNLFGWYAVGRGVMRDLRLVTAEIGRTHHMRCMKSTGAGYLLAFSDDMAAELAAVYAVETVFELLERLAQRNARVPEESQIGIRCAVHFGQVDAVGDDREGPEVAYTFRLEG